MMNGTFCSIKTVTTKIPIISEVVEKVVYSVFTDHVQPWPAFYYAVLAYSTHF